MVLLKKAPWDGCRAFVEAIGLVSGVYHKGWHYLAIWVGFSEYTLQIKDAIANLQGFFHGCEPKKMEKIGRLHSVFGSIGRNLAGSSEG